jgi:hypothetical protein
VRVLSCQSFSNCRITTEAEGIMKRLKPAEKWNWVRRMAAGMRFGQITSDPNDTHQL